MATYSHGFQTGTEAAFDWHRAEEKKTPPIQYTRRASKIVVPLRRTFVTSRLQDVRAG